MADRDELHRLRAFSSRVAALLRAARDDDTLSREFILRSLSEATGALYPRAAREPDDCRLEDTDEVARDSSIGRTGHPDEEASEEDELVARDSDRDIARDSDRRSSPRVARDSRPAIARDRTYLTHRERLDIERG